MNPVPFAAPLLALAGTTHGFIVSQFQIQPNQFIEPSSGSFYNYANGAWINYAAGAFTDNLLSAPRLAWTSYGAAVESSTWLAIDRYGGGGDYFRTLDGAGPDPDVPEWDGFNTDDFGAGLRKLDGGAEYLSGLDAGPDGYIWGYDPINGFEALSAVSPVNGVSKDSIFFGQFVLTDPDATLVGAPLLVTIHGVDHLLPLDGTPGTNGFRIEYERFQTPIASYPDQTGLRAFVVIPAPATLPLLAAAGLGARRRRRR